MSFAGTNVAPGAPGEPPLELPYYRAPLIASIRRFFLNYATFGGRAGRAELWWTVLASVVLELAVRTVYGATTGSWSQLTDTTYSGADVFLGLVGLATLVPSLAVTWRRLHDINRSGGWFFFGLIPVVGWITLLVFMLLPPDQAGQRFDRYRG